MLRIPHCLDSRLTDGGKVVSLTHRPRSTLQKHYYSVSGTHSCYRLSEPQGLVQPEGLGKLKKNHFIGSRTHDLPACNLVSPSIYNSGIIRICTEIAYPLRNTNKLPLWFTKLGMKEYKWKTQQKSERVLAFTNCAFSVFVETPLNGAVRWYWLQQSATSHTHPHTNHITVPLQQHCNLRTLREREKTMQRT
jgi:hypothetical protein